MIAIDEHQPADIKHVRLHYTHWQHQQWPATTLAIHNNWYTTRRWVRFSWCVCLFAIAHSQFTLNWAGVWSVFGVRACVLMCTILSINFSFWSCHIFVLRRKWQKNRCSSQNASISAEKRNHKRMTNNLIMNENMKRIERHKERKRRTAAVRFSFWSVKKG